MRAHWPEPVDLLLPAVCGVALESAVDASDRRQYTRTPFYGYPKMTAHLRWLGHCVNPERVRRLMRLMGLQAIYPKPRTPVATKEYRVYPYLLQGLRLSRPNEVWCADIPTCRCLKASCTWWRLCIGLAVT
jgi:hypothetical protein